MDKLSVAPEPPATTPGGLRFAVRKLIRQAGRAALATVLSGEHRPYVSLVTVATDMDGSPILLLSRLADHTRNIDADDRVSLLFDGTDGYANPQQGPRVSLLGRVVASTDERLRRRFLARQPAAALYAGFGDFTFYRLAPERAHWVGGFARAHWLSDGLICPAEVAHAFAAAEADILAHMNDRHGDTLTLMANRLLKRRGKGWRMVAVDPDGCDLAHGDTVLRLAFDAPLASVEAVRATLVDVAERARTNPEGIHPA